MKQFSLKDFLCLLFVRHHWVAVPSFLELTELLMWYLHLGLLIWNALYVSSKCQFFNIQCKESYRLLLLHSFTLKLLSSCYNVEEKASDHFYLLNWILLDNTLTNLSCTTDIITMLICFQLHLFSGFNITDRQWCAVSISLQELKCWNILLTAEWLFFSGLRHQLQGHLELGGSQGNLATSCKDKC